MKDLRLSPVLLIIRGWLIIAGILLFFHGNAIEKETDKPRLHPQKQLPLP